jgi:hypothetical protein
MRTWRPFSNGLVLAGLLCGLPLEAAPRFNGLYKGQLGTLEMVARGDRVTGYSAVGGPCNFFPKRRVLDGQLQGNVLVGTVTLCQTGPACGERVYPFLGFVDPGDGTVTGEVKLDAGCVSPALEVSRLVLEPSEDSKLKVRANPRKAADLARMALVKAQRLLEAGDYAGAAQQFEVGLSYSDQNWVAYLGLGVAELRRGNVPRSMDAFERSRDLARAAGQDHSDIHYNLACAQTRSGDKRGAMESLKRAVKLGFALPEMLSSEQDLQPLHEEAEFKTLVKKASEQRNQSQRRGG